MQHYEKALTLVNKYPELQHFVGSREALVAEAEKFLGLKLPPSYRRFVRELGAGSFGGSEVYGVIDSEIEKSSIPNGVWCTLQERKLGNLPAHLVILSHDGAGGFLCVDCADDSREGAVISFHVGYPPELQEREIVAKSFGEFFLNLVRDELLFRGHQAE